MRRRFDAWRIRLLYCLPPVLFCSYYPLIYLGSTGYMHLEIFLPLVWLALFASLSVAELIIPEVLSSYSLALNKKIYYLFVFPLYATISVLWTGDKLRGLLDCAIIWAIAVTIISIYQLVTSVAQDKDDSIEHLDPQNTNCIKTQNVSPRNVECKGDCTKTRSASLQNAEYERGHAKIRVIGARLTKIFFVTSVVACLICWAQSIFDVLGVSRDKTLLCAGCVYDVIGFAHPSGLAVEPQYMGNLLLAPTLLALYLKLSSRGPSKKLTLLTALLSATLFLTLSRGAILSFGVAFLVLLGVFFFKKIRKNLLPTLGLVGLSYLATLCFQGTMAAVAPTADTFFTGVTKSIHQMSLGKIDLRWLAKPKAVVQDPPSEGDLLQYDTSPQEIELAAPESAPEGGLSQHETSPQDASHGVSVQDSGRNVPVHFDGYIEESTNSRVMMNELALKIITQDTGTLMFGVGIGGSVRSVAEASGMREVIPNVYLTILLETGLGGVGLLIIGVAMLAGRLRAIRKTSIVFLLVLLLAYGLSINFFSGVTNVIHIYLIPAVLIIFMDFREKAPKSSASALRR